MRLNTAWRARQINTGYLWYENVIVDAGTYSAEDKSDCYHANPTKFTLQESAPNSHIAGEQHQFHVQARDNKGNRVTKGGDMITIFARFGDYTADSSCADLAATNPGVYKCTWKAVKAGRYTVDVKVRDQHIADSPFYVDLVAGAAFAGTSMVSNVEPVLKVGLPSSFTIVPRDMYGNTITDLQANSFQVDIKSGGGGNPVNQWVKVLQYGNSPYTPTADAAGDLTADTSAGFAKLSDVDINEMFADQQGWYYYKMTDERSETLFVRTKKPFRDTDLAFGWSGSFEICMGVSTKAQCSWKAENIARFETERKYGNNCQRWFADYHGARQCYAVDNNKRCFSDGAPCGHKMRKNVVMYKWAGDPEDSSLPRAHTGEPARSYSSVWGNNAIGSGHARSTLNSPQAWSAQHNNGNQWMKISLDEVKSVAGVTVQGRNACNQFVKKLHVDVSTDGHAWTRVVNNKAATANYHGSVDIMFEEAVDARYVKFIPTSWYGHISMRAGLIFPHKQGGVSIDAVAAIGSEYKMHFTPPATGAYEIDVMLGSTPLVGSEFIVTPAECSAADSKLEMLSDLTVAGELQRFEVVVLDQYGNPAVCTKDLEVTLSPAESIAMESSYHDGVYDFSFHVLKAGTYGMTVKLGSDVVPCGDYCTISMSSSGLSKTGVDVMAGSKNSFDVHHKEATFSLSAKDKHGNTVETTDVTNAVSSYGVPICDGVLARGHCYVPNFDTTKLSWDAAGSWCHAWGGHLASLNSQDEVDMVKRMFPANLPSNDIWMGLKKQSGTESWKDDSTNAFRTWATGQPATSGCGYLNLASGGKFGLRACTEQHHFVCKKVALTAPMAAAYTGCFSKPADYGLSLTHYQRPKSGARIVESMPSSQPMWKARSVHECKLEVMKKGGAGMAIAKGGNDCWALTSAQLAALTTKETDATCEAQLCDDKAPCGSTSKIAVWKIEDSCGEASSTVVPTIDMMHLTLGQQTSSRKEGVLNRQKHHHYYHDNFEHFKSNFNGGVSQVSSVSSGWGWGDHYSYHWWGFFVPKHSGRYNFWTQSDDASHFVLDDQVVVDNGGLHGPRDRSGHKNLVAGQVYKVDVYTGEYGGQDGIRFQWARNGHGGWTSSLNKPEWGTWFVQDGPVTWSDSSGNNLHAKQSNDVKKPKTAANDAVEGTFMNFDSAGDQYLALDKAYEPYTTVDELTVCVTFRTDHKNTGKPKWSLVDFDGGEHWGVQLTDAGYFGMTNGQGGGSKHDLAEPNTLPDLADKEWHMGCAVLDKTTKTLYREDSAGMTQTAKATMSALSGGSSQRRYGFIGDGSKATSYNGARNGDTHKGDIADVAVWGKALQVAELSAYKRKMSAKVGFKETGKPVCEIWKGQPFGSDLIALQNANQQVLTMDKGKWRLHDTVGQPAHLKVVDSSPGKVALKLGGEASETWGQLSLLKYNGYFHDNLNHFNLKSTHLPKVASQIRLNDEGSHYSYKISGYLKPQTSGSYEFWTQSDDASYVYIDGQRVVHNGGQHGMQARSGSKQLNQGQIYSVEIYFGENGGGAALNFQYKKPGVGWSYNLGNDGFYTIEGPTPQTYLSAKSNGDLTTKVAPTSEFPAAWNDEQFTVLHQGDGTVMLKTHHNKFITQVNGVLKQVAQSTAFSNFKVLDLSMVNGVKSSDGDKYVLSYTPQKAFEVQVTAGISVPANEAYEAPETPGKLSCQKYNGYFNDNFNFFSKDAEHGATLKHEIRLGDEGSTYSYKCKGYLRPKTSGGYQFWTRSDDASYVFINDQKVVNNGGQHGNQDRSGSISLTKDETYKVELFFGENHGGASFHMQFKTPGHGWTYNLANDASSAPMVSLRHSVPWRRSLLVRLLSRPLLLTQLHPALLLRSKARMEKQGLLAHPTPSQQSLKMRTATAGPWCRRLMTTRRQALWLELIP
jgi:fibro-slime domain-containing protein